MATIDKLKSKEWRMSHLYTIVDRNLQKRIFKKNRAQEHFDKNKHTRNIILKSRRLGFTTFEAIDMMDDTLFNRNFSSLFIAHTKNDAIEIFDKKFDFVWRSFHPQLAKLWKVDSSTANKLKFDFGENNYSSLIVSNSGRSGINNRVHCSEFGKQCAKYPKQAKEFFPGTMPSVPHNGRADIESTAEGMGGEFYDVFWEAWDRSRPPLPTEFKAHFYNWQWDDEDIANIKDIIPTSEMDEGDKFEKYKILHNLSDIEITYYYTKWLSLKKDWDLLHQEYPTTPEEAFIASGNSFFYKERLTYQLQVAPKPISCDKTITPPLLIDYIERGDLILYENPRPEISYVFGADVAEGKGGGDNSSFNGINNNTAKPVLEFRSNKIRQDDYAKLLDTVGRWYNNAYLGVESNSGLWVLTELFEKLSYPNLYWREEVDSVTHNIKKQLGFNTNGTTRKIMLDNLNVQVNTLDGCFTKRFIGEAYTFIRNDLGRPEAMEGKHDDDIISTGICHYIRENAPSTLEVVQDVFTESQKRILARLARKNTSDTISQDYYI